MGSTFPERPSTISIVSKPTATADYDYELPVELIAQSPAPERDASRLMVIQGDAIDHRRFADLPQLLRPSDVLVLNETRVIAARLLGRRVHGPSTEFIPSGVERLRTGSGQVELLLLHPAASLRYDPTASRWIALARPARRLRAGDRIAFGTLGEATIVEELADGLRAIELQLSVSFEAFLERAGRMPLPPYIHNDSGDAQLRYQTVFARAPGSVAAPTASLHFTPELLDEIEARGTQILRLSLNVGLGTFRPVTVRSIEQHVMDAEAYAIEPAAARAIERARRERRRIVAAGTTVVRALEGNFQKHGRIVAGEHETDLFIRPGFRFQVVGAMITNFHLPRSTLLVLVSAFGGFQRIRGAYTEAIERRYRFYSFGDAMFVA